MDYEEENNIRSNTPTTPLDLRVFQLYSKGNELNTNDLLKYLRILGNPIDEESIYNLQKNQSFPENITYDEFSNLNKEIKAYGIKEEAIRKSFEFFDTEKTGFIPISVLEKIFPPNGDGNPSDLEELIRLLGEDDMGRINYESFLRRVYGDTE